MLNKYFLWGKIRDTSRLRTLEEGRDTDGARKVSESY